MKKLILFLFVSCFSLFELSGAPVELLNIDFSRDSASWKTKFPVPSQNGADYSVSINDTLIDSYMFSGRFGRFNPGATVRAQPLQNENQIKHRRWSFRLTNNSISYMELPELASAGKFTIFCKNGNQTIESVFYLQKLVEGTWVNIRTLYAPPHYDKDYEQQIEEYLNIDSPVKLRIYGATKFVHLYEIRVNAYDASVPMEKPLKLILVPDAQTYANNAEWNVVYAVQTIWITNNSDSIKFVIQQGDMTQTNKDDQWSIAAAAFTIMDGKKLPFSFVPGNHDMGSPSFANTRNTAMLNKYLPYSRYSRQPSFGGVFEANKMENTWSTFSKGDYKFLILSLEYGPRTKVINWAKTIIEQHPKYNIIINTHAYLNDNNSRATGGIPQEIGLLTGDEFANDGQDMWDKLVKLYLNCLFVFNGHVLGTGIGNLTSTGTYGNKVYQYLANYQGGVDGAQTDRNGMLRIVDLYPEAGTFSIKTYSPYTKKYNTAVGQQFLVTNVKFIKDESTGLENPMTDKIKIYPDGKNIRILNDTGNKIIISIFNLQGQKIEGISNFKTDNFTIKNSGCYIICVRDENNTFSVRKKIIIP